jgi:hypothetical protein
MVEDANYGKWLVVYIHLNPVRCRKAGAILYTGNFEDLSKYRWSSHLSWIGKAKPEIKALNLQWLGEWGSTLGDARKAYLRQMQQELSGGEVLDWKLKVEKGLVVGGESFVSRISDALKGRRRETGERVFLGHQKKKRSLLVQTALLKEQDPRIKMWIRVRILGENQVALAKELGYASSSGIFQTLQRLERSRDERVQGKLNEWREKVQSGRLTPNRLD